MNDYSWIWQLSAGGALIFFFYLLLHFLLKDLRESLKSMTTLLESVNQSMANRDQIILNHLEHFMADEMKLADQLEQLATNQAKQSEILHKLCRAWEINGGDR